MATTRRRSSMFGTTKLGYEGGHAVNAEDMLHPIGEKKNQKLEAAGLRRASVVDYAHAPEEARPTIEGETLVQPQFDHSPIGYVHKHTESVEYNSLQDPLLKKHFRRSSVQKTLVEQAMMTPDGFVLHTHKKHHVREQMGALKAVAEAEGEARRKQRKETTFANRKYFEQMCAEKMEVWRNTQREEATMVDEIKHKMEENRVSVEDAPLTEQGELYYQAMKEAFEEHQEKNEIRAVGLEAERKIKAAAWEKKLREETAARKQAYQEAVDLKEAELAMVKANIVETKAAQERSMQQARDMMQARQDKARSEADAFRHTMVTVFTERQIQQQKDIEERKRRRQEEVEKLTAKREAEHAEKMRLRAEREAKEKAEYEEICRVLAEEERQRKAEQAAEKERRAEAKRAFQAEQLRQAQANKEQALKERAEAKEAERVRVAEQAAERQRRLEKNQAEKQEREQFKAAQAADKAEQRAFEVRVAKELQETEMAAQMAEAREAERQAFEAEMEKQEQAARAKATADRIAKKQAAKDAEDAEREAQRLEIQAKKDAAEKKRKDRQKKENLKKARAEMDRRVAYMNKFGV